MQMAHYSQLGARFAGAPLMAAYDWHSRSRNDGHVVGETLRSAGRKGLTKGAKELSISHQRDKVASLQNFQVQNRRRKHAAFATVTPRNYGAYQLVKMGPFGALRPATRCIMFASRPA